MAEPGSHSTNATADSAAPQHDWEVLSISMSASAFGNPNSARDGKTGKAESPNSQIEYPNPQIDNPYPLVENPSFELGNPSSDNGASGSEVAAAMWTDPFHAGGSSEGGDKITEPFTEGWKPHLSTSADLHRYGSEDGYGEGEYQEGTRPFNQSTEPSLQRDTFMSASKDFWVTEVTEAEKGVLLTSYSTDVDVDQPMKKKRARKSRSMWSIAVAVTVVGIVMLGHHWQIERHHNQQLRLELSAKDEKLNNLMYQVSRLKEVIGGHQKASVVRSSSF